MAGKTKLELTWIGKDIRPRLEPRILIEEPEFSHHAASRKDGDIFDNLLIHGDNLLALKALETDPAVRGKVKCVFIDPPYNTGSAFEHYDDGLEHSLWLGMMRDRLEILRCLLKPEGSLWITVDDNEAHYLKVLCDEVFGRRCFIANIIWRKRDGAPNDRKIGAVHDHVLVYAKDREEKEAKTRAELAFNLMERTEKADSQYRVFSEPAGPDPRGPFRKIDMTANAKGGRFVESLTFGIKNPHSEETVFPRPGTNWRHNKQEVERLQAEGRIYWGVDGGARTPMRKLYKSEAKAGMASPTIWDDVGLNQHAARELELLFEKKATFETPKPEFLMQRIIHIATNPGDLVLDSFAGSGTTGAVAHKMGRRWIMVELGDHAKTHIVPRMQKVIDGSDKGGVTEATGWTGGGGYRFVKMAPSLLEKDAWGNWVIAGGYNPAMLAEAVARHFGFTYAPSPDHYWMHGSSSESSYIYVTTASLTHLQLRALSDEVGDGRSLLVCCTAYEGDHAADLSNLTIRKIPGAVLDRCEWGRDDYSLKIESLPMMAEEDDAEGDGADAPEAKPKARTTPGAVGDLFAGEGE
jgi:adenine-specific DNA-methyltransferase